MTGSKHRHHVCMWTSCLSDHRCRGRPSPSETEHVVIAIAVGPRSTFSSEILFFLCVSYSSSIFYHVVCRLNLVNSASVCGRRRRGGGVGGAGLKRAALAVQRSPHQSTPDQSSQQASHHKKHCGGCSDSQDGVPTYLTLLGRGGGGGDRKTVVLPHTAPAGGHLQEKYFRKRAFVQRVGELVTLSLEMENWN